MEDAKKKVTGEEKSKKYDLHNNNVSIVKIQ